MEKHDFSDNDLMAEIHQLFRSRGSMSYLGEPVSQLEHALQAAWFAEQDGADATLITAALLHDIGHLLHDLAEDCAEQGIDDNHEQRAEHWLAARFSPPVTRPIALHVAAKRYLAAVEPSYFERLSPASRTSLIIQGGVYSLQEAAGFLKQPYAREAVRLRRWDDLAKAPELIAPPLEHFLTYVTQVQRRAA